MPTALHFWSASFHSLSFLVSLPPWSGEPQLRSLDCSSFLQSGPSAGAPLLWQQVCPGRDFIHISPFMQRLTGDLSRAGASCEVEPHPHGVSVQRDPIHVLIFQFHFLQLWLLEWKVHVVWNRPESVRFLKKNIFVGVNPSGVVEIKTWLRRDDATLGPSVISCVSIQWNSPSQHGITTETN